MRDKKSYTEVDFYEGYELEYPDNIQYKLFKAILEDFNKGLRDLLIIGSEELILPYNIGEVKIVKYRPKTYKTRSLSVDFKATRQLGKTIYHLNEHSDGYKFRLYWSKLTCNSKKEYRYRLNFTRANKRLLASLIINNKKDYIEL